MSTLTVSTVTTANNSTNESITTGNSSGPQIILYAGGNISLSGNSTPNTVIITTTGMTIGGVAVGADVAQTLTDQATVTWNVSDGKIATVTLGGNRTMAAPTNLVVGTYVLHVIQDGTGTRLITWNSIFKWPAAIAPTLSTTAAYRDIMTFVSDGTNLFGTYVNDLR